MNHLQNIDMKNNSILWGLMFLISGLVILLVFIAEKKKLRREGSTIFQSNPISFVKNISSIVICLILGLALLIKKC